MKRFYTVKEASEILGFSTVYKYLKEGKLKGKRIGRGRFKIPYEELEPYLPINDKVEHIVGERVQGEKITKTLNSLADGVKGIAPGVRDFIFFRFFIGIEILGAGFINLFWVNGGLLSGPRNILPSVILIGIGTFSIITSLYWQKLKKANIAVHAVLIAGLLLVSGLSVASGKYYLGVFLGSFAFLFLTHIIRGFENCCENATFKKEFIFFSVIATTIMGILTLISPEILTVNLLSNFAEINSTSFAVFWFGLIVFPFGYLLFPGKEDSRLANWIFGLNAITSFFVASGAANRGMWDLSFGAFIYGIFLSFLLWWSSRGAPIVEKEFHLVGAAFFWIALAVILGLLAIQSLQEKLKAATLERMQASLSVITTNFENIFSESEGIVDSETKRQDIAAIILSGDAEAATFASSVIYEKSGKLRTVFFMDADGEALGTYPRNELVESANFSSREYFRVARATLRPYVTSLFETILNIPSIVQAIPVFSGNSFVGAVILTPDLAEISKNFQNPASGGLLYAFDEKGKYVLHPDETKIGSDVPKEVLKGKELGIVKNGNLRVFEYDPKSRITLYLERDSLSLFEKTLTIHNLIFLVIVVNAGLSLAAAFVLARKWKP